MFMFASPALVPPPLLACRAPVTALNLEGYGLAFAAVCWYNYQKLVGMQTAKPTPAAEQEVGGWVGCWRADAGRGPCWLRTCSYARAAARFPPMLTEPACLPACPALPPHLAEGG